MLIHYIIEPKEDEEVQVEEQDLPYELSIEVEAGDNERIDRVEVYVNEQLEETLKSYPYLYKYEIKDAGEYVFGAKAYDEAGNVSESGNVTVAVTIKETDTASLPAEGGLLMFIRAGDLYSLDPGDGSETQMTSSGNIDSIGVRRDGLVGYGALDIDTEQNTIATINYDGTGEETIATTEWALEPVQSLSISPTADVIYFSYHAHQLSKYLTGITRLDMNTGVEEDMTPMVDDFVTFVQPAVSPSGGTIACLHCRDIDTQDPGVSLCIMNADGSNPRDIVDINVSPDTPDCPPCWSPDGTRLAFVGEGSQIWTVTTTGQELQKVTDASGPCCNPDWSPDGKVISFEIMTNPQGGTIYYVPSSGGEAQPLTTGKSDRCGRWVRP